MDDAVKRLYDDFPGKLMTDYVWWVLQEAEKEGIKTLYFLARDGWLLRKIALVICEHYKLDIACKYLYCSRISLRTPSYWLIGEEAFDLLLCGGYQLRLDSILQRAQLSEEERQAVYKSCGWNIEDESKLLSWAAFKEAANTLRGDRVYRKYVLEKSRAAYPAAMAYLKQEGLLDADRIAIVDSGWTGSMQRSLRQLLESAGWKGKLDGYYFGMYKSPQDERDGRYHTWYFSGEGFWKQKARFSNNLFECLLSAPHGMTSGYRMEGEAAAPVLMPPPTKSKIEQIEAYALCVTQYTSRQAQQDFWRKIEWTETDRIITRYMYYPTEEEAFVLGQMMFCDDITEAYQCPLADRTMIREMKRYTIPGRVKERFFSGKKQAAGPGLYWQYGTIAFMPKRKAEWYRTNVFIWQYVKYMLGHI